MAGQMNATQLKHMQPVGVLVNTRLSFEGASPNSLSSLPAKITVSFDLGFEMIPGDLFMINLPGFTGSLAAFDISSSPIGAFLLGSWLQTSSNPLVLTAAGSVPSGSSVKINVDINAGILLPPEGVQLNARIGIASTAQNGPLPIDPPTYFGSVAPIGSFLETTKLFFMTPRAESVTAMRLLFTPTFMLQPGETVTLSLPADFSGKFGFPKSVRIESTPGWWTKAYSHIITLESCLTFSGLPASADDIDNRKRVIAFLAHHNRFENQLLTNADLVSKCAMIGFTKANEIRKLSEAGSQVTLEIPSALNSYLASTYLGSSVCNTSQKCNNTCVGDCVKRFADASRYKQCWFGCRGEWWWGDTEKIIQEGHADSISSAQKIVDGKKGSGMTLL